jgi:hypothetical protein
MGGMRRHVQLQQDHEKACIDTVDGLPVEDLKIV